MNKSLTFIAAFSSAFVSGAVAQIPAPPPQGNDTLSKIQTNCVAFYPKESARKREEGAVVVQMIIGTDGVPHDLAVEKSSGFPRLDEAAIKCVGTWRFRPMLRDGQPTEVAGHPTVVWKLQ